MNDRYDAIIIGGGIGGGALATVLARAGRSVLVLEKTKIYRDRVRGEWLSPWGVVEAKKLGLYDALIAAGAHHLSVHRTYGESADPAGVTELPLAMVPDVPGPLCMGHPAMCALFQQTARDAGATFLTDVPEVTVMPGSSPCVTYTHDGAQHTAHARIIIGADGRGSVVRRAAGIELHRDPTHHIFSGLLIEDCHGIDHDAQVFGTEGDVHYLVFPQGNGRARLYIGFPSDQPQRFAGDDGPKRFLETFGQISFPGSEYIASATAAGPCNAYPNEDTWTDVPYAEGVVLVGDAAGHNDPIIGQGLSITLTDVRIVSEALLSHDDWRPDIFTAYAEDRRERMRRLRFSAHVSAILMNEFGPDAQARRESLGERAASDPTLRLPQLAAIIGPYAIPEFVFDDAMMEKLFA